MEHMNDSITKMSDMLIYEILIAAGLPRTTGLHRIAKTLFQKATRYLAKIGLTFDQLVMEAGFPKAAEWALSKFCKDVQVRGVENLPAEGPLLVISNHPGTFDGLVLISQLPRKDIHLIASAIPVFRKLPNAEKYLIFISREDTHQRMSGAREAIRLLKKGRLVYLCGSGTIDPDPAVYSNASRNIDAWYSSVELFPRLVPETHIVFSIVSHVVSPKWANHFLTRLKKKPAQKQRIAELGQIIQQLAFPGSLNLSPRISFSRPFTSAELQNENPHKQPLPAMIAYGKALLEEHCANFGGRGTEE